jgi:hypothetical protein
VAAASLDSASALSSALCSASRCSNRLRKALALAGSVAGSSGVGMSESSNSNSRRTKSLRGLHTMFSARYLRTPGARVPSGHVISIVSATGGFVSASGGTDASGNQWTITSGGQVAVNGSVDGVTSSVTELAYVNGTVWQETSYGLWWGKTSPTAS